MMMMTNTNRSLSLVLIISLFSLALLQGINALNRPQILGDRDNPSPEIGGVPCQLIDQLQQKYCRAEKISPRPTRPEPSDNDLSPTANPSRTPKPTGSLRPSPSSRPSGSPAASPPRLNCNQACSGGRLCASDLTCIQSEDTQGSALCRNPDCPEDSTCLCSPTISPPPIE